jgi:60 kDa SS-A/Ro ribonucleoprotein
MKLFQYLSRKVTPQSEPVPGVPMVPNSAGGYSFAVDDWTRLDRFLVLGSEGGSYYASERKLTLENANAVVNCAKANGVETVRRIVAISDAGRAPKNDYAVFALAIVAASADAVGKKAAYDAVPMVCRTGTHLFQFAAASDGMRGWGRGLRQAIAEWYLNKPVRDVAYQVTKYQQRDGWSHRDLLRLSHAKTSDDVRNTAFKWAVGKAELTDVVSNEHPLAPIHALEAAKRATTDDEIVRLINEYRLVREAIPTQFLTSTKVWEALLTEMPLTALLRNLATMTRIGLLTAKSAALKHVLQQLTDAARLKKARVHPLSLLIALKTYESGKSLRGSNEWVPLKAIVNALDDAFYLAFQAVEPTNQRWMLALDVSGSMTGGTVAGAMGLTPRVASAAMALVTAGTESSHQFVGFSDRLVPVNIKPGMRLDKAIRTIDAIPMGGTDCALPMIHATEKKIPVDVFVVYTDSETWFGNIHPFQALTEYRSRMGIPAKLIVVGLVANQFTIADPSDAGMLDIVGFDASAPAVMSDFARHGTLAN